MGFSLVWVRVLFLVLVPVVMSVLFTIAWAHADTGGEPSQSSWCNVPGASYLMPTGECTRLVAMATTVAVATTTESTVAKPTHEETYTKNLEALMKGYPMAKMSEELVEVYGSKPEIVALLVGIARKESAWGKYTPKKNGKECYNYWGYTGLGSKGRTGRWSCFADEKEAVQVVGKRLATLAAAAKSTKPKNLTVWKCGNSCAGHSKASVKSWISQIDTYYKKALAAEPKKTKAKK